jgi:zinc protease
VATAKTAFLQQQHLSRSQDNRLAGQLANQAFIGRTMQREIDLENRISDATPAQLTAAFKKWVDPTAISYFKAGDFKKAAAK